ncbi:MAG: DegV family protein [Pseudomonadota bacterium]|nr:DegV family protein [Pseudomonadota bacterium]
MQLKVQYIDVDRMRRALTAGLHTLISEKDFLNDINVFPIADGDTGNNLSQTARAALIPLKNRHHKTVKNLLNDVAYAALDGAQGNSGTILAQYFLGLAEGLENNQRLATSDFQFGLINAAKTTRDAIENPREGTIISVIDKVAETAQFNSSEDFAELLPELLLRAKDSLQDTTDQPEELRIAGVVDAGGHGFVSILDGCMKYLKEGLISKQASEIKIDRIDSPEPTDNKIDVNFRYCIECLVSDATLEIADLRKFLQPLGESLVIAGSKNLMRIHIHSNNPNKIFNIASQYGKISKTKADDMIGQSRSLKKLNRHTVIVTDSACDIPEKIMMEQDIHMIPLRIQLGDKSYLDKSVMSSDEFRKQLENKFENPGTSQPSQGDFTRTFEFLGSHYLQVISINLSSHLSGTFRGAKMAIKRFPEKNNIKIIDSANISAGQGLLVAKASELVNQGYEGDDLLKKIEAEKTKIRTFVLLANLDAAVRSGRVHSSLKTLANIFHITPILTNTPSGKIGICGYIPGRFNIVERFAKLISKKLNKNLHWDIAISHSPNQNNKADVIIKALKHQNNKLNLSWTTDIGAALGIHAGMDAIVIAIREDASK